MDSLARDRAGAARPAEPLSLSAAVEAVYGYAADPDNWEEMDRLIVRLAQESDERLLGELRRHLERADDLARRLHREETPASYACVRFDDDLRVVDATPSAHALLERCCAPVAAGRPLRWNDTENADRLRAAHHLLGADPAQAPQVVQLVAAPDDLIVGYLLPAANLPAGLLSGGSAAALALVAPDPRAMRDAARMVPDALGLTPAEGRLAARLGEGLSLKESAAALDITLNTARNQLKSIFDKLGISRQSDLVRHLTVLSLLGASLRAPAANTGAPRPQGRSAVALEAEREFLTLADGRRLAYRRYGRLGGTPVMLLHSNTASSLVGHAEAEAANRAGVHLVSVERPGIGLSTPHPAMTHRSFAEDAVALTRALRLDRPAILGRSTGAPFALAVAAMLGRRARLVLLCSARLGLPAIANGQTPDMPTAFFHNMRRHGWAVDAALSILRRKLSRPLMRALAQQFFARSAPDRHRLRQDGAFLELMVETVLESVAQGHAGLLREGELYALGATPDLSGLTAPVAVWHGEADGIVPAQELRRRLADLPHQELRLFPGEGHLFTWRHLEAIYARLTETD